MAPSLVRSEKFEFTTSSDGGDVALHAYVLMFEAMPWGMKHPLKAAWENGEWEEKVNRGSLFS